ncbi:MAG TPA: hypothetical protein VF412_06890 [Bdellovibrio sp.]|uniref:hypothetical protein n=1 Tax=Bdellovibrio sp. TaxID=28201 RepID=UPI002F094BB9
MKALIASVFLVLAASSAFAVVHEPEFCKMGFITTDQNFAQKNFDIVRIDVVQAKSITAQELALVNDYLIYNQMTSKALSLAEIQDLFGPQGQESHNELYLEYRTSKVSGEKHVEVYSYPGDNAVGTVYNPISGKVMGYNGDGSYSYFVHGKETYCSSGQ